MDTSKDATRASTTPSTTNRRRRGPAATTLHARDYVHVDSNANFSQKQRALDQASKQLQTATAGGAVNGELALSAPRSVRLL